MEFVEVNVKELLKGARYIGKGKTAFCFLLRDGTVFKYYRKSRVKKFIIYGKLFRKIKPIKSIK